MKKVLIAFSCACASAFAMAADNATPQTKSTDWFSASATSAPSGVGGSWENPETPTVAGNKFVIDSELANPVTFNPTNSVAQAMTEVAFTLDTAIVPYGSLADLSQFEGAKVAFAASEDSSENPGYYAWLGSGWVPLTGKTPVADVSYTLVVKFDNREGGKKVQFKVDNTVLTSNSAEWLGYTTAITGKMAIDFVGSGNVASFAGSQLTITSEVVVVDGGKIEIKEEDMAAFKNSMPTDKGYNTVDDFIADFATHAFANFATPNIRVGTAYALGLVVKNDAGNMVPKDGGQLIAKALAEANVEGIKLGLNVTPPQGTGAKIDYAVYNGDTKISSDCVIPSTALEAGLKKFTVKATVTPKAK